jgi:hypothetical protein
MIRVLLYTIVSIMSRSWVCCSGVSLLKPVMIDTSSEADEGKEGSGEVEEEKEGVLENSRPLTLSELGSGDGVRGIIWSCFNVSAMSFN